MLNEVIVKIVTYILTHNSPPQLQACLDGFRATDASFFTDTEVVVVDQSTLEYAQVKNQGTCSKFGVGHKVHPNAGASGGRWRCAQLFHESDADLMYFFEDDLILHHDELRRCRYGFPSRIQRPCHIARSVLHKAELDYVKLTFHELYYDHSRNFLTKRPAGFEEVSGFDGVGYFVGDVYYSNWPMLIRRQASERIFAGPPVTEGAVMARVQGMTLEKRIRCGVLAAWPVRHCRLEDRPGRKDL